MAGRDDWMDAGLAKVPAGPARGDGRGAAADGEARIDLTPWPAPPAPDAYHGLSGEIVRAVEPQTEADPVAILAQLLTFFGSAAGRNSYRPVEARRHYPNLYCVLVGRSSKARKGTSLSWIESLFAGADPAWMDDCIQGGLSSGEGVINAVRDEVRRHEDGEEVVVQAGARDKRLLIIEEEFASVLAQTRRVGNILSSVLRQAWDGGRLRTMTKHNPLRATDAHLSIVGHVTRDDLVRHLAETDAVNGFANRFLWLCARRSKVLPDGGEGIDLSGLQTDLSEVLAFARVPRRLSRGSEATRIWYDVYPALSAETPGILGAVTSRAEAQVLRLSVVYALLDGCDTIGASHLRAALALWDYCLRSCAWIFGEGLGDEDADRLLAALRAAEGGLTLTQISAVFGRNKPAVELKRVLSKLVDFGLVLPGRPAVGGRPAEPWRVVSTNPTNPAKPLAPP
jgi:hypothetical protein